MNKIISTKQFGLKKNIGTKDALAYITDNLYDKMGNAIPTMVTFLDLAKAFDTVNHVQLFSKLHDYEFRGKILMLLRSYLSGRFQKVNINGTCSSYESITIGVPQGSILGPLLFIIYLNDLLVTLPNDTIMSYADDTAIICSDSTWSAAFCKMNDYLHTVANWMKDNQLSLNLDKTIYMVFGSYINSLPPDNS